MFGGGNETQLKQTIAGLMKHKPILVDNVTLFQSASLIQHCSLFLCNDTGLMHVASHFKIPTVVVAGHTNPEKTKPLHDRSQVITPDVACKPYRIGEDLTCLYAGTPEHCMNKIKPEDVYHAIEEMLP